MRVCYWGTYDREYSRNRIIIGALKQNGVQVIEYNYRIWKGTSHKLRTVRGSLLMQMGIVLNYLKAYSILIFRYFRGESVDAIIVGYSGHPDVLPAKLLSVITGKPLIFDAFLSIYDLLVFDRAIVKRATAAAVYVRWFEKMCCLLAARVLLDTDEHIKYFVKKIKVSEKKFRRVLVSANADVFDIRQQRVGEKKSGLFSVLYYGKYIPLHGLEFIVRAAEIAKNENIFFKFIGDGQDFDRISTLVKTLALKNIEFLKSVPLNALPNYISAADLCLGIFGATGKAQRVIPNKVYECAAMRRAVISGDSPAIKEVFTHGKDIYLCPMADSVALADAILTLKNDSKLRESIAGNAYKCFQERLSFEKTGTKVAGIIQEVIS